MSVTIARIVGTALAAALASGCLDLSPAPYSEPPRRDGGRPGGDGSADSGVVSACRHCLIDEGAPCRSTFEECQKEAKCPGLIQCALGLGCLSLPNLADVIPCAQPCLDQAGIVTSTDPATLAAAPLFFCSRDANGCKTQCGQ